MKKTALISVLFLALPFFALAQVQAPQAAPTIGGAGNLSNVQNLVKSAAAIIGDILPIIIALALIFFFYGLVQYIRKPEWEEGRKIMIAGLVSLFVMVAVWGIVDFAASALGVGVGGSAPAPGIPGYNTTATTGSTGVVAP